MSVSAGLRALEDLRRRERELVEEHARRTVDALDRVRDGIHRLSEIGSPEGFLVRAAEELGASSDFDRVVVSEVLEGVLAPQAVWVRDEEAPGQTAERMQDMRIPLAYPLPEAEVARTRRPALVAVDQRSPAPLRE